MDLFDKALVVSADGKTVLPVDGAFIALVEGAKISYYDLPSIIENVVTSCGRFMLDESLVEQAPLPAVETLRRRGDIP